MLERDCALRTENANGEGVFRWQRRDAVFSMGLLFTSRPGRARAAT
jgi:hypothetical protein